MRSMFKIIKEKLGQLKRDKKAILPLLVAIIPAIIIGLVNGLLAVIDYFFGRGERERR